MEAITDLVASSLARNGFVFQLDLRRLQWSNWSRCDLTAPNKAGVYALATESNADPSKLIVASVSETDDLGTTLTRLSWQDQGYVRFCVVEDPEQRRAIHNSLQESRHTELPAIHNFAPTTV